MLDIEVAITEAESFIDCSSQSDEKKTRYKQSGDKRVDIRTVRLMMVTSWTCQRQVTLMHPTLT